MRGRQRGQQRAQLAAAKMCGRPGRSWVPQLDRPTSICLQRVPSPPSASRHSQSRSCRSRQTMPALELRDIVRLIRVSGNARPPFRRCSCRRRFRRRHRALYRSEAAATAHVPRPAKQPCIRLRLLTIMGRCGLGTTSCCRPELLYHTDSLRLPAFLSCPTRVPACCPQTAHRASSLWPSSCLRWPCSSTRMRATRG